MTWGSCSLCGKPVASTPPMQQGVGRDLTRPPASMQRLCPACAASRGSRQGKRAGNRMALVIAGAVLLVVALSLGLFWFAASVIEPDAASPSATPVVTVPEASPVPPSYSPEAVDPFPEPAKLGPVQPYPIPLGSPGSWVTPDDYPARALREEREGTTGFALAVGPDGRVRDCAIVRSSGHPDLDSAACRQLIKRGRFDPARGEDGRAREGQWSSRIRWQIP